MSYSQLEDLFGVKPAVHIPSLNQRTSIMFVLGSSLESQFGEKETRSFPDEQL